jgi:hypothetical protein
LVQWPKNAPKYAIAIDLGLAEIWLGQKLVNGGQCRQFAAFAAGLCPALQIDKRHWNSFIFARALSFPKFVSVRPRGFAKSGNGR